MMSELSDARLAANQRKAIRKGELKVKPPYCGVEKCWNRSDWWVTVKHPIHEPYPIPRCDCHQTELPYDALSKERIELIKDD